MTQKEKELLLKDLCARLPYGVKYQDRIEGGIHILSLGIIHHYERFIPYLRPMSSMTEKELNKLRNYTGLLYDNIDLVSFQDGAYKCLDFYLSEVPADIVIKVFDWLNSHYFDYRGLISMGLALEAPKDMYN